MGTRDEKLNCQECRDSLETHELAMCEVCEELFCEACRHDNLNGRTYCSQHKYEGFTKEDFENMEADNGDE